MEYLIIFFILLILLILFFILRNKKIDKKVYELLKKCEKEYKLIKAKGKAYDYVLRSKDLDIYLAIIKVPKYSEICINSKDTWHLSYNVFSYEKGKGFNNNRYLDELKTFLKNDIETKRAYLKVVFIYKDVLEIVRYLNESELDCIDINKSPYGIKITTYNRFEEDLKILLKK